MRYTYLFILIHRYIHTYNASAAKKTCDMPAWCTGAYFGSHLLNLEPFSCHLQRSFKPGTHMASTILASCLGTSINRYTGS